MDYYLIPCEIIKLLNDCFDYEEIGQILYVFSCRMNNKEHKSLLTDNISGVFFAVRVLEFFVKYQNISEEIIQSHDMPCTEI